MIAKTIFSLNQLYLYPGPDVLQKGIKNTNLKMLPLQVAEFLFLKEKRCLTLQTFSQPLQVLIVLATVRSRML